MGCQECKIRTRLEAKIKLFGVLPDELKTILGHDTAKKGALRFGHAFLFLFLRLNSMGRVFESFQCRALNKRFCYVMFEALLIKVLSFACKVCLELTEFTPDVSQKQHGGCAQQATRIKSQVEGLA